jgi:hypothetical protein
MLFRVLLAFGFFAHGVAHLIGYLAAWRIRTAPNVPYTTTVLGGAVDIGTTGTRALGLAWLLAALAFAAVPAGTVFRTTWWRDAALWTLLASSILCLLGWPAARLGLLTNLILGAAVLISRRSTGRDNLPRAV